jgi:hypothetical protein
MSLAYGHQSALDGPSQFVPALRPVAAEVSASQQDVTIIERRG